MALVDSIVAIATTTLIALAIGAIGYLISGLLARAAHMLLARFSTSMVATFVSNLVYVLGILATGYFIIQYAGVTGIFVIIATAATGAFAIGSQRIAADTIAGIKLFIVKYYKIGDWVTVGDYYGEIMGVNLTYTVIQTLERDQILIPNADAVNAVITNHSLVEGHYLSARIPIIGKHSRVEITKHFDTAARAYQPQLEEYDPEVMLEEFGVQTTYYLIRVIVPDEAWDLPNEARLRLEIADAMEAYGYEVGEAIPFLLRE